MLKNICLCLVLLLNTANCCAETLDELTKSERMGEFDQDSARLKQKMRSRSHWMDPQSDYASLFEGQRGAEQMLTWLVRSYPGYTKLGQEARKENETASAQMRFIERDSENLLTLTIILPHPRYINAAKLGLLKAMIEVQTPPPNTSATQELIVRDQPAVLYLAGTERCDLKVTLDKGAVLRLQYSKCENSKRLLDFARGLDIQRLVRKMNQ
ncbi:MAG: hypothetical protein K1X83_14675 [Oligoflexia bacterium]|nr:hypothetical protein [Oligoflexia bacterium]